MIPGRQIGNPGWRRWPVLGTALLLFAALSATRADADLWGHVRFGLDILRDRTLPTIDPYSFTQDRPWINHEWLSEIQMALAYRGLGSAGIALLKGSLASVVFFLVWNSLTGVRAEVRVGVLVLVALGTIHMTATLRPQLWSLLSMTVLCRTLVRGDMRSLAWVLPVLFALWANLHGGWVVGFGVLGAWAVGDSLRNFRGIRPWVGIGSACLLATLATPYGWRLWEFLFETVRVGRRIDEWGPLWITPWLNWLPWFAGVAGAIWVALRWSDDRKWSAALVLAMLAYGSARVMRIESLFVVAGAIVLAPALRARWPAPPIDLARQSWQKPAVALILFAVLVGASWRLGRWSLGCVPVLAGWAPELEPVEMLKSAQPGRLVTHFNWGEYALWHLAPLLRVSIDGRRETVYSDRRLAEYQSILSGGREGLAALAVWRPEYVWLPTSSRVTREWLMSSGYRLDFDSGKSFIATRGTLPPLRQPSQSFPRQRCFPR